MPVLQEQVLLEMQSQSGVTSSGNGASTPHDLFALTDEQILEIEPEAQDATVGQPFLAVQAQTAGTASTKPSTESTHDPTPAGAGQSMRQNAQAGMPVPQEPPPWLAAQMKDPWSGEEARELWNGVQQARQEAAAYRAAYRASFANPEDARALKELYPGGVSEARGAAERARILDDIDRAYFGATGNSAQEISASREQLAQRMLRENPAAFREMVFAGLHALEEANVATAFRVPPGGTPTAGATQASPLPGNSQPDGNMAAYSAFEKAANEDLERSVGASIERTLDQALPNIKNVRDAATVGARYIVPLHERLNAAIRQDVEVALKGDRQLSEQVAQILSSKRLDNETRAQVVRLIGERAQQLVPVAAKRVLSDWTQTTLAAHRTRGDRSDAASSRREVSPASAASRGASFPASTAASSRRDPSQDANRSAARPDPRRVDYRKLSDEQILDL